jgi:hypothetical protein
VGMKPFLLLVVLAGAAFAQDCPVQVTDVIRYSPSTQSSQLIIYFTNSSGKEISKTTFVVSVLDSAGNPHLITASFEAGKTKVGGKKRTSTWVGRDTLDPITKFKYQAGPHTVQFADGTSWSGDTCLWTQK